MRCAWKEGYINKLNEAIEWIYGAGQSASNDEYKKRLEEFKKIGMPIKERARFHGEFPIFYTQF